MTSQTSSARAQFPRLISLSSASPCTRLNRESDRLDSTSALLGTLSAQSDTVATPVKQSRETSGAALGADHFDPLRGYPQDKPLTPPASGEDSNPAIARKASSSRAVPAAMASTRIPREAAPAAQPTRRTKLQPPKDPHIFATHDEWNSHHEAEQTNAWHHLPLALVALPPLLSIIHGRAENWSDAILLLLVAFYLYQLVKVPWEMYYASHTRVTLPQSVTGESSVDSDPLAKRERDASAAALRRNEMVALLATAVVPAVGAYLLNYVRTLLSDPDRYINPTLINMFAIATTVKPFLHFVSLLKHQSLYHQEVVHYPSTEVYLLRKRVDKLENDLVQLSRAFATKSDVRALRDGVDAPLNALSKAVRRFNRKEEYLRLTSEERFTLLSQRLDESIEVSQQQQAVLEELEQDRQRSRELDFATFLGRVLGHVFALPTYDAGSAPSNGGNHKRTKGRRGGTELGWYERGITWYLFWPVNLPKKAVGWAAEKAANTVRGIEAGFVEEKEIKLGSGKTAIGPLDGRRKKGLMQAT
ncbi:uncharacterized protein JCM15063_005263 [Sporobolomyces koalae]|uniref:uncharacterized protein n=1 Tax=Sporobolomyces koalae TaxID=500713 RepID=UPI00316FAF53